MATVVDHLAFVRTTERLRMIVKLLQVAHATVSEVHELDPALSPELLAISNGIMDASAATARAVKFLDARLEVKG